ncbi:hypothetical protein [Phormidesmis priestleyi]|nr:hypothetical protein [Phormidesmis priestleyi]
MLIAETALSQLALDRVGWCRVAYRFISPGCSLDVNPDCIGFSGRSPFCQ